MKKCECQICGDRFDKITSSHLRKHGLTRGEYCEMFPQHAWQTKEHFVITPTDKDYLVHVWERGSVKGGRGSNKRY